MNWGQTYDNSRANNTFKTLFCLGLLSSTIDVEALTTPCHNTIAFRRPFRRSTEPSQCAGANADNASSNQDIDSLERRKELYCNIWEWGKNIEGSFLHPSIEPIVRHPSEGGAGIVAVEPIPSNTVVMSIPMENSINIQETLSALVAEEEKLNNSKRQLANELQKVADSSEGGKLAALVGIFAHLHLTRLMNARREVINLSSTTTELPPLSHNLDGESLAQQLGPFLDTLPMLPLLPDRNIGQQRQQQHPFPSHVLFWTDDEIDILLNGTIAQTIARSARAGAGAIVGTISSAFLKEYCQNNDYSLLISSQDILDALIASHAQVLSRSFGGAGGENVEGIGRQVFPILDLLNHDGSNPTVRWGEDGDNAVVETSRDINSGEELLKDYGWRPSWDFGVSYGFVPYENLNDGGTENKEYNDRYDRIYDAAGIPIFPAVLDLNNGNLLDLTAETNYGPLVKIVLQAATKMKIEIGEDTDSSVPEIASLFRQAPFLGENCSQSTFGFPRRQPCFVLSKMVENHTTANGSIKEVLEGFRAAASLLSIMSLRCQTIKEVNDEIIDEIINVANAEGDEAALNLMQQGINDRIQMLESTKETAQRWGDIPGNPASGLGRVLLARQMRLGELNTLRAALKELSVVNR